MRKVHLTIDVYRFDELDEKGKNRAREEYINDFLIETDLVNEDPRYRPAVVEMDKNQTPWFLGETLFRDYRDAVDSDLEEYSYLKDGKIYTSHDYEAGVK